MPHIIVIEKPQIVAKPRVVTSSKIAPKVKKVNKLKIVDKSEIVIEKKYPSYDKQKKHVTKQLKKLFDTKKSGYLDDDDDEEYKGIRDLEYLLVDVNENDEVYYKPERARNAFKGDNGEYNYRVYESRESQYYESLEEYLSKIRLYLENMIREYMSIGEWKM